MSFKSANVRFLTMEEAEAYLACSAPTHPIYPGDPRYEDANWEIGFLISRHGEESLVPAPPINQSTPFNPLDHEQTK